MYVYTCITHFPLILDPLTNTLLVCYYVLLYTLLSCGLFLGVYLMSMSTWVIFIWRGVCVVDWTNDGYVFKMVDNSSY